jgi:hypothetical protein
MWAYRRFVLLLAVAGWLLCFLGSADAAAAPNPIEVENAKPGTTAWQIPGTPSTHIAGYASQISVQPDDVLRLHVSTASDARYRIEIYRLGWYRGDGGRRVACLPSCNGDEAGVQRPVPMPDATTGQLDPGWPVTDAVSVALDWTSGYYLAKLVLTSGSFSGQASYIPFIVRAPLGSISAILVQASVNTWEAYNNWGGKSLYAFNSTGGVAATKVSFSRPFSGSEPQSTPLTWEYPLVRFIERHGYDVSYQADVDTDMNPGSLLQHRLDVVSGHDEYWSKAMRDAFDAARNQGVNLAFVGANIGDWQLRYENADRTLVEYRSAAADPTPDLSEKTVRFRDLSTPRPECQLLGIQYQGGLAGLSDASRDYTVQPTASGSAWFQGTSLNPGDILAGAVGYEWDGIQPGCSVPPVQDLMHWQGSPSNADAVTYQAPSDARVFSLGTLNLIWSLDDLGHPGRFDLRVEQLFGNLFNGLGSGAPDPNPPSGAPQLQSPADGASNLTSPVTLRWSVPQPGIDSYTLEIDGHSVALVNASVCVSTCVTTVAVGPGQHQWQIQANDSLGNMIASQDRVFTSAASVKIVARHAFVVRGFVAKISLRCPGSTQPCHGTLKVFRSHRLIGQKRFFLSANSTIVVRVNLNRRGRTLMRHYGRLRVEVVARSTNHKPSEFITFIRRFPAH